MKLDPDLIKRILTAIEETKEDTALANESSIKKTGISFGELTYHLRQLIQGGYINGEINYRHHGKIDWYIQGLTWKGHDFVANSKNDTLWNKAKTTVASKSVGISVDLLSEVLKKLVSGAAFLS